MPPKLEDIFADEKHDTRPPLQDVMQDTAEDNWYDFGSDLSLDVATGVTNVANLVPAATQWATSDYAEDEGMMGSIYRGAAKTSDVLGDVSSALQRSKSDYARQQSEQPIISRDKQGDLDFNMPNWEQVKSLAGQSLAPAGVIGKAGMGLSSGIANITKASPKLAAMLGFGAANTGYIAPSSYDEVRQTARDYYINEEGLPEDEANIKAAQAGQSVAKAMAGVALATGMAGGFANRVEGGRLLRMIKGGMIEAAPEAAEEATQSVLTDYNITGEIDPVKAANVGAMGAIGGLTQGAVFGGMGRPVSDVKPDGTVIDETTGESVKESDIVAEQGLLPNEIKENAVVKYEPEDFANWQKDFDESLQALEQPIEETTDTAVSETPPSDDVPQIEDTQEADPMKDSKAWRGLYDKVLKPVVKMPKTYASAWRAEWNNLTSNLKQGKKTDSGVQTTSDIARMLFYSNDGYLRALSSNKNSEAVKDIANMLYSPAGRGEGNVRTYGEAVDQEVTTKHNKVFSALEPFAKDEGQIKRMVHMIQNPEKIQIGRSKIDDASQFIHDMLRDERQYMVDAGLEVGDIGKGYFPRVYDDMAIMEDEAGFTKAATEAYMKTDPTMVKEVAEEKAKNWLSNVKLNGIGVRVKNDDFIHTGNSPVSTNVLKARVLSKEADDIMKPYLINDPVEVLMTHFMQTSQTAEFERRFGQNQWESLKKRMIDEGVGNSIPDVVKTILSSVGSMQTDIGLKGRSALSWLKTFGVLRFLPRATLTSLSEIAMPAIQTGDVRYFMKSFADGFKILRKHYDMDETMKIAREVVGTVANSASDAVMADRVGGMVETRMPRYLQKKFFEATLLHQFTETMRGVSTNAGISYLNRLADDMVSDKRKSAEYFLADLGIPQDKTAQFANWIRQVNDSKGGLTANVLDGNGEYQNLYKTALGRFVDQTVMKPKGAERPRYAQHPVGSMFYFLQSFAYGFTKNVLKRNLSLLKEAGTGKGYNIRDRLALSAPSLLLPSLFLIQLGLGELRDEILKNPAKKEREPRDTFEEIMMSDTSKALSRAGAFGALDTYINLVAGVRYERDPATGASGAIIGELMTAFKAFANTVINNTENTDTAERNAARTLYNIAVIPMLNAVGSIEPTRVLGATGIQAASHPATREAFVDAVIGKKDEKGRKGKKRKSDDRKGKKRETSTR